MNLDEAIRHAREVEKKQRELYRLCPASESDIFYCNGTKDCKTLKNGKNKGCIKCAKEHQQLAKWLKDYKQLLEHTEWVPSDNPPEKNGWYQCTVLVNDSPLTMELFYQTNKWVDKRRIDMFNVYDIYGYGCAKEKHKLSYQELISEFDWTERVIAWKSLPEPYRKSRK